MLQFQWPPPDVTHGGFEMDKFKQVSNDHHHMSLAGGPGLMSGGNGGQGRWGPRSDVQGGLGPGGGACTVRSNVSWTIVTWDHPPWTE